MPLTTVRFGQIGVVTPCARNCMNCHWLEQHSIAEVDGSSSVFLCSSPDSPVDELDIDGVMADVLSGDFYCSDWTPEDPTEGTYED